MPNRLALASSPYLIQHADNPVDWWEWEPAAFAEARRRGVPVLLSVGYSSCHWCHVFARESFEDEVVAAFLNEHFVNIKVDREERPDIDAVYMEAVQAATGQGGWPMTVFLTPDAEPFYFGTYFPPAPRNGMPSFRQVLEGVRAAWADRRDEVAEVAGKIVRDLSQREISYGDTTAPGEEELTRALLGLTRDYDAQHGGFGGAPKFPPSMIVEFLLRHHARSGSEGALQMAADTCERMARGGIYDQLGGGFARYSVDREWQIPHFEKMLYDNALLCRVYAHLWRATGSELARRIALETADFMVRELRTDEGGSPPRSTPTVMTGLVDTSRVLITSGRRPSLPRCSAMRMRRLPRTTSGSRRTAPSRRGHLFFNFRSTRGVRRREGRLHSGAVARSPCRAACSRAGRQGGRRLERARHRRACRDRRVLRAARSGGRRAGRRRSSRTGSSGRPGASLPYQQGRSSRGERRGVGGLRRCRRGVPRAGLRDGGGVWLEFAGLLLDHVLVRFVDAESGSLYDTASDAEQLIRRPQDPTDNAVPSGWSAAAGALLGYAAQTGAEPHRAAAERALGVVKALGPRVPRFIGWGLAVAEALLDGPREVAVVGPDLGDPATIALHRVALLATAPGAVVAVGVADSDELPLLAGRPLVGGAPTAYVCRNFTCDAPTTDPEGLRVALGG